LGKKVNNIKQIYVPPFVADMGGAIGSAMEVLASLSGYDTGFQVEHAFWGYGFEDEEINRLLKHLGISSQYVADPTDCAAELICKGEVIAWCQGRMEVGPRALGNRSILARPDEKLLADHINREIKNRESWRPFSPSAIQPFIKQNWRLPQFASAYMTVALEGKNELESFPGISHVDNTSRVQSVNQKHSPRYYALIEKIGQITANPVVLNTSLNLRNMPIVCRPSEALQVFFSSPLDALIIGSNLLMKK
jgi:carbamoyltransferase